MIDRIIERDWYDEYICPILIALRVFFVYFVRYTQESHMNDTEIISIVNKVSYSLGKAPNLIVSSMVYQVLLLTNESVARVVLLSLLQNIKKKCPLAQLPAIINHFGYALKSNSVSLLSNPHSQPLCKIFLELMKSSVLPLSHVSLFVLFSLTDSERFRPSVYSFLLSQLQHEYNSVWYRWNYPIIAVPGTESSETIVESFLRLVEVVESGYQEGAELLIHWNDHLLHWSGHSSSFFHNSSR